MNIIVSTHDSLSPIKGGGAIRTLKVAEELKKRGHKVIIIAPTDKVGMLKGIKVHWLHPPKKQYSQILSTIKFNVRLFRKFIRFVKTTDIFFVHNTIAALTLPFLKKIFGFRFVLDITDIHAEYLPVGKRNIIEIIVTPFLLRYEYWIIKSADFVIVVTEAMKKLLIAHGIEEERLAVVYDGADEKDLPQNKQEADLNVIHLGAIDRQHGVDIFIRAIPLVLQKIPEAKFFLVGGGRELGHMRKLAEKLKVDSQCIFTDFLPCEKARQYLVKACVGVIPRPDYLPNRIVTTLKLYEYWASATAVVASSLAGIREIAEDRKNILFFSPSNEHDLAEKIILLLTDKELRERIVAGGLVRVKDFTWSKIAFQIGNYVLK